MARLSNERRSALAKQIIENPLWPDVYRDMRLNLFTEFCNTLDLVEQQEIGCAMRVLSRLEDQLGAFITEGKTLKLVGDNDAHTE